MPGSVRSASKSLLNLLRGRPVAAVFEVCLRCNSDCGYCNLPLNIGRYEMSREEIRTAFEKLRRFGLGHVFVQGGEPLVRKDLPEILTDLHGLGLGLSLVTNGTLLNPDIVARLARLPIGISVSLDTLDRERYRRIRGTDHLPRVLAGIDGLEGYPHPKYLTCIVSEQNRDDVLDVVRFARKRGFIPVVGAYHWGIERYGKIDAALQYEQTAAIEVFEEVLASNLVPRGYFRNYLHDNIRWLRGERLSRCDAGRHTIAIDASGNVSPCLAHSHAGNLLDADLDDILAAMDRESVKACSDASTCNLICGRVVGSSLRHPIDAFLTPARL